MPKVGGDPVPLLRVKLVAMDSLTVASGTVAKRFPQNLSPIALYQTELAGTCSAENTSLLVCLFTVQKPESFIRASPKSPALFAI
jgi:hypothetical protein